MSDKIIYQADGTVARVLHVDKPGDFYSGFTTEVFEDVEPIIDSVKTLREDQRPRGDMKHVARVPVIVVEQAMREGWFHDQAKWNRWLNDSQNRDFRVWEGKV